MRVSNWSLVTASLAAGVFAGTASAQSLSSYAIAAADAPGSSTGATAVALGIPDYQFVNDSGLSFGGTNTDVFDPNETTVFQFATPLKNVAGQPDMKVSAFVGGAGATDNATVQVETSSDGVNFLIATVFDTADGRTSYRFPQERAFESVKHFEVEFGAADNVTHVRLSNLGGTSEGLRLDALEGYHPHVLSNHAFEIRFERYRGNCCERFLVRIKNLATAGGAGIREFRINRPTGPGTTLEETQRSLIGLNGEFMCVENCVPDNGPLIPFSRHAWSLDGVTEAPTGIGLAPGEQASHSRWWSFDLDTAAATFLSGYSFVVTFTDSTSQTFDFDSDVIAMNEEGMEYQKYQYFGSSPAESMPRRVHYYQFTDSGQVASKQSYGTGCLGLTHDADVRPVTGSTIQLATTGMPAGTALGATVLSLTQLNPGTNLTPLGLTGCFQYVTLDLLQTWLPIAGVGQTPFAIPNNPGLAGFPLSTQGVVFHLGVNPADTLTSNGLLLTVGNF